MKNTHIGSNFNDFLNEEDLRAETEAAAIKRVIAYQIEMEMKKAKLTKSAMAEKMQGYVHEILKKQAKGFV